MRGQVIVQAVRLLGDDLERVVAHELGPTEAEGAVGVAGLPLAGKEQHGFAVLVLETVNRLVRHLGDVQLPLPGGVRVELFADLVGAGLDLVRRSVAPHQVGHVQEVALLQHALLRESNLVEGVVGHPVPVDEIVDHVPVGAEGQHVGHYLHGKPIVGGEPIELRNLVEMLG